MEFDQTYTQEVIRIFEEFKQTEDERGKPASVETNPEGQMGEHGGVIYKKKKKKGGPVLSVPTVLPSKLIYQFLKWIQENETEAS